MIAQASPLFIQQPYEGKAKILRRLLDFNRYGRFFVSEHNPLTTPTCIAAKNGHLEAVKVLADISGAQFSAEDIEKHKSNIINKKPKRNNGEQDLIFVAILFIRYLKNKELNYEKQ